MRLLRVPCLTIVMSAGICAQQISGELPHVVRATGEATVTAKPDRAEISIGVTNQAATAHAAAAQNANQTGQVLDAVKKILGTNGEVKTAGYSVNPVYDYSKSGGNPRITGYSANNTVMVKIDDLTLVANILDNATLTGANNINGISFTLRDDSAVRTEALAAAAVKAKTSAEAIAHALGLKVTGVREAQSIEASYARPVMAKTMMMSAAPQRATPVESGTLDIHAEVVVTLDVQ